MAQTTMPPVPYSAPMVDSRGVLTLAWAGFFRELYKRIGGNVAPSNADITTVQTTTTTQATSIAVLDGGLTQGRQL